MSELKFLAPLNFLASQFDSIVSRCGDMDLQWRIDCRNDCVAIISRPLSSAELQQINLPSESFSTTTSCGYSEIFNSHISIWCTFVDNMDISLVSFHDILMKHISPMRDSVNAQTV